MRDVVDVVEGLDLSAPERAYAGRRSAACHSALARERALRESFSRHGTVRGLKLSMDIFTRRCKGIAMTDMEGHEARGAQASGRHEVKC